MENSGVSKTYLVTVRSSDGTKDFAVQGDGHEAASVAAVRLLAANAAGSRGSAVVTQQASAPPIPPDAMEKLWGATLSLLVILVLMVVVERRLRRWLEK